MRREMAIIFLILLMIAPTSTVSGGKPPSKSNPLTLNANNIITREGNLNVWGHVEGDDYVNVWSGDCVGSRSIAVGNADNDRLREIVVINSVCNGRTQHYEISFNVYKEGVSGIWKSSPIVEDTEQGYYGDIRIADVDGDGFNEVVLMAPSSLVIYKYNGKDFEIKAQVSSSSVAHQNSVWFEAMAIGNLDDTPGDEIAIAANEWNLQTPYRTYAGHLIIFREEDLTIPLVDHPVADAYLAEDQYSICIGNKGEICATVRTRETVGTQYQYQEHIYAWFDPLSSGDFPVIVKSMGVPSTNEFPINHIAVGNLGVSDTVVLIECTLYPNTMSVFDLSGNPIWMSHQFEDSKAISQVLIADPNGDGTNEVIVGGSIKINNKRTGNSASYLEVWGLSGTIEWQHVGNVNSYIADIAVG